MTQVARKVVIASAMSNGAARLNDFSGTTLGELKAAIPHLATGDVEYIVKPGNVTLNGDDSILPEGDFNCYIVAKKNKAGMTEGEAASLGAEISAAIVAAAKLANTSEVEQLKEDLIDTIANFFDVDSDDITNPAPTGDCVDGELTAAIAEAKSISGNRR